MAFFLSTSGGGGRGGVLAGAPGRGTFAAGRTDGLLGGRLKAYTFRLDQHLSARAGGGSLKIPVFHQKRKPRPLENGFSYRNGCHSGEGARQITSQGIPARRNHTGVERKYTRVGSHRGGAMLEKGPGESIRRPHFEEKGRRLLNRSTLIRPPPHLPPSDRPSRRLAKGSFPFAPPRRRIPPVRDRRPGGRRSRARGWG